jgi:GntR family histidine utilization transcriptional repressor
LTTLDINNWQGVQSEVLNRINSRFWKPGDLIPNEAELAREFGCARATVNRALRAVADQGLLDRRRKAGTRVAMHPVRKATLSIPIIRQEIEDKNLSYSYALISREVKKPPIDIRAQLNLDSDKKALHVQALYLADDHPYVSEDRWVNIDAVRSILDVDLAQQNANEWLVANAPYTRGYFSFSAINADSRTAELLGANTGDALFVVHRRTWNADTAVTAVKLTFHSGYGMKTSVR